MSFLTSLLASAVSDDRYWVPNYGASTAAGMRVGPDSALALSAVWACDRLLSETIASLPAITYELLADGGRKRATNHPLYDLLKRQPNAKQTAFEFFDFMTHCAIMRGNAYARIIPGPRGFADQLDPLHPDCVRPERLVDGRLRYTVREPGKPPAVYTDEEILHVRGPSFDGVMGVSVVTYARESMGMALAAERYGGRFFANNTMPGGVLASKGKLTKESAERLKADWEALHAGANAHRVAVLEDGLTWQTIGINNRDSQFLETREFQAEDICRWFRVPPHMVGLTSKVTSWGSGIEQLGLGFITYTLLPWLVRWQQAITRDLILAPDKYFVEFLVDALLKGDLSSRYSAYAIGREKGWLSANDVRRAENMNPIDGGDEYIGAADIAKPEQMPIVSQQSSADIPSTKKRNVDPGENADPKETLNGAQIASMLDIVTQVVRGEITKNTATEIMVAAFPFDERRAGEILADVEEGSSASSSSTAPASEPDNDETNDAPVDPASEHYRLLLREACARVVRKEIAAVSRLAKSATWSLAVDEFYRGHAEFVSATLCISAEHSARWCNAQRAELINAGVTAMNDWQPRRVDALVDLVMEAK